MRCCTWALGKLHAREPGSTPISVQGEQATTEQAIARKKNRPKNVTGTLHDLSDRFVQPFREVQEGVTAEYTVQEDHLQKVEDWLLRVEKALVIEQARRVKMYNTVQSNLQQQCDTVSAQCHAQVEALAPEIPGRIHAWHERCEALEELIREESIAKKIVIDREKVKLIKTVEDFQKQLELEKVERLCRETYVLQQLSEEMTKVGESFDIERRRRETVLGHERDSNDQIDAMRDKVRCSAMRIVHGHALSLGIGFLPFIPICRDSIPVAVSPMITAGPDLQGGDDQANGASNHGHPYTNREAQVCGGAVGCCARLVHQVAPGRTQVGQ